MTDLDPLNPPAHAVRLRPGPIPDGARPIYVERYRAVVAQAMVAVCWITPEEAARLLEAYNAPTEDRRNRRLSSAWRKLAAAIGRGAWFPNGESIVFDHTGRLINGQHRLKAIAAGRQPAPIFVVFGIDPAAFATFDSGRKRSPGDVCEIQGYSYANTLASAANWARRWMADAMDSAWESLPNDMAADIDANFPGLADAVVHYTQNYSGKILPGSLGSALYWIFRDRDPDAAEVFFKTVCRGIGVVEGSHADQLRRRLEGDLSGRRDAATLVMIAALCVITFNRLRAGSPPKSALVWRPTQQRFPNLD